MQAVDPGQHQHLAAVVALGDHRDQPGVVPGDGRQGFAQRHGVAGVALRYATVYGERDRVLRGENLTRTIQDALHCEVRALAVTHCPPGLTGEWNRSALATELKRLGIEPPASLDTIVEDSLLYEAVDAAADAALEKKAVEVGEELWPRVERAVILRSIDQLWVEHLTEVDDLRRRAVGRHTGHWQTSGPAQPVEQIFAPLHQPRGKHETAALESVMARSDGMALAHRRPGGDVHILAQIVHRRARQGHRLRAGEPADDAVPAGAGLQERFDIDPRPHPPPVVEAGGGVFGFFRLISASAFELKLFIIYKSKKLIFD